jgi:hypothetical protein
MYLDNWMIVTLILSFGLCAWMSRRSGFAYGAIMTLQLLEKEKLIKVQDDGSIKRWAPYNEAPTKKKRTSGGPKAPK